MFNRFKQWLRAKLAPRVLVGMATEEVPDVREVEVMRLMPEVYAQLVKSLPGPACPKTDLEAGYILGVQAALQKLREGFVVVR